MLGGMPCPVCGHPIPEDARFCPNCGAVVGTPLGTEERKMVTVLFADLVDSTGLAQRLDAERAREILGRFFSAATEELQNLRGRPEKFIGDAVMAVFGLPHVHEDDAVRAVRAGLAIRARVRRLGRSAGLAEPLDVRVGIESGEAAVNALMVAQALLEQPGDPAKFQRNLAWKFRWWFAALPGGVGLATAFFAGRKGAEAIFHLGAAVAMPEERDEAD